VALSRRRRGEKISTVVHAVHGNKATVNTFGAKLSTQPADFEVKYTTTGAAPASIVYAVDQASGGLMFTDTPSGSSGPSVDIIVNWSGEYACTPGLTSTADSCERLPPEAKASENQLFEIYTPTHWVTFLRDFSIAAGFVEDKVTSSTMTVNGFACPASISTHRAFRGRARSAPPRKGSSATSRLPRMRRALRSLATPAHRRPLVRVAAGGPR
jgi:hypothetical protein